MIGPDDVIVRPKATAKLDAEAELVVVIKDRCRNVAKEEALEHVLGYTCGNDVSARDWQSETTATGGGPSRRILSRRRGRS